jgi:hypothetical protein
VPQYVALCQIRYADLRSKLARLWQAGKGTIVTKICKVLLDELHFVSNSK